MEKPEQLAKEYAEKTHSNPQEHFGKTLTAVDFLAGYRACEKQRFIKPTSNQLNRVCYNV